MFTVVFSIHIALCVFLIGVVLLQQGKGADLGAAFSGSSSSLFGAAGASSILVKITTIAAILFMMTSIGLIKIYSVRTPSMPAQDSLEDSVFSKTAEKAAPSSPEPASPEGAAPPAGAASEAAPVAAPAAAEPAK